jgi:predicted ATPase
MDSLQLTVCSVDLGSGLVEPGGERLTPRELELLRYLAARPRQVVSRQELLQQAFGYAASAQSRAVDKAMVTLRKKVEQDPAAPDHLLTAERAGYRFAPAPEGGAGAGALVGRVAELLALRERLARPGLVTLHGPGGVGKTALARCASQGWARAAGRPAWICRVGEGGDRADLVHGLAAALGVSLAGEAEEQLARAVAARAEALIVLDGFEGMVAHADLLDALLHAAPRLHLLLTSRVPAGLAAESVLPVPPLSGPEAVQLLALRARERGQPAEPEGLEELADRLDRLPLALELAVPWLGVLGARGLAQRLAHPLELPQSDGLRRMLLRSWQQLDEALRQALAELSVFRGGFRAERAEAVLSPAPDGRPAIVLLESLLRASLLQRAPAGGQVRLSLLDTVRAYAAEQLDARGRDRALQVHRAHARALLAAHGPRTEPDVAEDRDDLVEAVRQTTRLGEPALALGCLELLHRASPNVPVLVLRPLSEALLACASLPGELRGEALILQGRCLKSAGELEEGERVLRSALPLVRQDPRQTAEALVLLGWVQVLRGDLAEAARSFGEAHLFVRGPDQHGDLLMGEFRLAREVGDFPQAASLIQECHACYLRARMPLKAALASLELGILCMNWGEHGSARSAFEAALELCRRAGSVRHIIKIEGCLAELAQLDGDVAAYAATARRMVELQRASGAQVDLTRWLSNLGYALLLLGQLEGAREVLVEANLLAQEAGLTKLAGNAANHMGQLLAAEGQLSSAETELVRACALLDACGEQFHVMDALCSLAVVRHRLGRTAEGEKALARAAELADSLGVRPESVPARSIERTILALRAPPHGPAAAIR